MREDSTYSERTVQLNTGDALLVLTDGFTEAMDGNRETFGTERLEHLLHRMETQEISAETILERIKSGIEHHVGSTAQHDDMTMVVVRVL